jgi:hypothetical protein
MLSSFRSHARTLTALVLMPVLAAPLHAGTPLICHPYAIGDAKSLPGSDGDWKGVNPAYDRTHVIRDTLAILTPDTPLLVRMETLRRAAIYATAGMRGWGTSTGFSAEDRANAFGLLEQLRTRLAAAKGPARALALFDAGFYAETLRHTRVDPELNGYDLLVEARTLRPNDPDLDFALALASSWPNRRVEHADHLARARAGAKSGTLLARNLASHFSRS